MNLNMLQWMGIGLLIFSQSCAFLDLQSESGWDDPSYSYQKTQPSATPRHSVQVGMSMLEVRDLWGEPEKVQLAGDVFQQNQRWIYRESSLPHWEVAPSRVVYFEGGRVVGWETTTTSAL